MVSNVHVCQLTVPLKQGSTVFATTIPWRLSLYEEIVVHVITAVLKSWQCAGLSMFPEAYHLVQSDMLLILHIKVHQNYCLSLCTAAAIVNKDLFLLYIQAQQGLYKKAKGRY